MKIHRVLASTFFGTALLLGTTALTTCAIAATPAIDQYIGEAPPGFADPAAAVAAFTAALVANDFDGLAKLLGLNGAKLKDAEGIKDRFADIREAAAELVALEGEGDQRLLNLGDEVWPFPFPLRKGADGKWSFDTKAGIEEVINRRIGENELTAIETAHAYVDAQRDYAADDHDRDGVLEYAQKLVSNEGKTDGLYWPAEQGDGDSPAGPFVSEAELRKAKSQGYFGYRFRILHQQGSNVAGGQYDYVINGNMIAGFALIVWPVRYGETGVKTFTVNHAGIVYEKDLGPDTEALVGKISRFNPDKGWAIAKD